MIINGEVIMKDYYSEIILNFPLEITTKVKYIN